jgi:hypothetical protein
MCITSSASPYSEGELEEIATTDGEGLERSRQRDVATNPVRRQDEEKLKRKMY